MSARPRNRQRSGHEPRVFAAADGIAHQRVALVIEMSNAHSRGILHGIRRYMREHESWMIRFSEQGRGSPSPR